jgi:hypothetical protein
LTTADRVLADFCDPANGLQVKTTQHLPNAYWQVFADKRQRALARAAARAQLSVAECLREWESKRRPMGCVSASDFVCVRVPGFRPLRLQRQREDGIYWEHVVATNEKIIVDLVPHMDIPDLS